jgi:hypothetical protein
MSISNKGGNFLISYENFENTMDSILDKEEYLKKNNIEIQRVEDTSDTPNMENLKNEEDINEYDNNETMEEPVEEPVEETVEEPDTMESKSILIKKNELLL